MSKRHNTLERKSIALQLDASHPASPDGGSVRGRGARGFEGPPPLAGTPRKAPALRTDRNESGFTAKPHPRILPEIWGDEPGVPGRSDLVVLEEPFELFAMEAATSPPFKSTSRMGSGGRKSSVERITRLLPATVEPPDIPSPPCPTEVEPLRMWSENHSW
ncbi:hypothetical protein Q8A67_015081 [Cirrhinus molitorella]|uniref:Uncharacterized protein n=1 Tax=Cirrhinus molitorella TaxID=172907 RepID=A0AA88TLK1_9TELE|nr:hypothetical protein Q8A67_015081 [Cirrhinus molitorella]